MPDFRCVSAVRGVLERVGWSARFVWCFGGLRCSRRIRAATSDPAIPRRRPQGTQGTSREPSLAGLAEDANRHGGVTISEGVEYGAFGSGERCARAPSNNLAL